MPQWGLIGASTIAKEWVANAIRAQAGHEIAAVVSADKSRGEAFAKEVGAARAYTSAAEMLAAEELNAVYISTTNELHTEQTLAAAASGAHVLCEKPPATSLEDAARMIEACEKAGVVLGVNHHLRGAATHEKMRELVSEGALGRIVAARIFHAVYLPEHLQGWRLTRPEAGGGVILDITVHDADAAAYILNAYPKKVTAAAQNAGMARGMEDGCMSVWEYEDGAQCFSHESFAVRHAGTGFEIHGEKASLIARDVMTQRAVGEVWLQSGGEKKPVEVNARNLYEHALEKFAAAMEGNGPPLAGGVDGFRALAVALAVRQSATIGSGVAVDYGDYSPLNN